MCNTAIIIVLIVIIAAAIGMGRRAREVAVIVAVAAIAVAVAVSSRSGSAVYGGSGIAEKLHPHHNELLTRDEIKAVRAVDHVKLPMSRLPRTADVLPRQLPYRPAVYKMRTAHHVGQRKLLLSEVDFLTDYTRPGDVIVYAGSAPGIHTPFLAELFPAVRFELYDPRDFDPRCVRAKGVATHQEYFTDEIAQKYAGRDDILFVSDIRTGVPGEEDNESRVAADMEAQQRWTRIMNPRAALLKYRPPYDSDVPITYLGGSVRLQAWAPRTSSEGRLVAERPFNGVEVAPRVYESQMFYLNAVLREWAYFEHGIPIGLVPGLDRCFDCALESAIWSRFLGGDSSPKRVAEMFNRASKSLTRRLDQPPHGDDPGMFKAARRDRRFEV